MILHVVDAFTDRPFAGNPAAVCVLPAPREAAWMRLVAREMNLAETSFLHAIEGGFALRWFTPAVEVALCGHATLAAAHALWSTGVLAPTADARFHTQSGWLVCRRLAEGWIEMDFPALPTHEVAPPPGLAEALGVTPRRVVRSSFDFLVELADAAAVRATRPDFARLREVDTRGVIVTARGDSGSGFDFVSRFFAPRAGIDEDPVTGSAHCALAPYWRAALGRDEFSAAQLSPRGGVLRVALRGDRALLRGQAVLMSRVELLAGF